MISDEEKLKEIRVGQHVAKKPRISVIMPAYNSSAYIAESVKAVLSQSFKDFELIVINDGSKDTPDLEKALEPYFDRITYISRENGGPGAARNSGIRVSKAEYLGFVDGDDVWYPEFLEKQLSALHEKNCGMINCDALYFGDTPPGITFFSHSPPHSPVTTESLLRGESNLILSGTLVEKAPVVEAGLFREEKDEIAFEDYELWFRLCRNGLKVEYNKEVLLRYRVHESNISGDMLKIVERGLVSGRFLKDNYDLNDSELLAFEYRMSQFMPRLAIEKAKIHLAQGNYDDSLRYVIESTEFEDSIKMRFFTFLMRMSPSLARSLFRLARRREFESALKASSAF